MNLTDSQLPHSCSKLLLPVEKVPACREFVLVKKCL